MGLGLLPKFTGKGHFQIDQNLAFQRISLNTIPLSIDSRNVLTRQGVKINAKGAAQIKIESKNPEILKIACTNFLGKSEREIQEIALGRMEGHQRSIMGQMTVEEVLLNRRGFAQKVFEVASIDMMNMGLHLISYVLTDINDNTEFFW